MSASWCAVAADARRSVIGPDVPIHLYGARPIPASCPFSSRPGSSIFDSASYGHFALGGWYMTPYGSLRDIGPIRRPVQYRCTCPDCRRHDGIPSGDELIRHNLWTILIDRGGRSAARLDAGTLPAYMAEVLEVHGAWFPGSALAASWRSVEDGRAARRC